MDKHERIEKKKAELFQTFEEMPEEQLKVARDLIGQAAYLSIELEDLAEIISKEGMTEEYSNGENQSGRKISSNAKMYNSLIGKYNTIVNSLLKIVPRKKEMSYSDAREYIEQRIEAGPEETANEIELLLKTNMWDYKRTAKIVKAREI